MDGLHERILVDPYLDVTNIYIDTNNRVMAMGPCGLDVEITDAQIRDAIDMNNGIIPTYRQQLDDLHQAHRADQREVAPGDMPI